MKLNPGVVFQTGHLCFCILDIYTDILHTYLMINSFYIYLLNTYYFYHQKIGHTIKKTAKYYFKNILSFNVGQIFYTIIIIKI